MLLRLDGRGPRYAQITRALCGLIQSGALAPGTRVPPTRDLARELACSRNLVLLAYEHLMLEGYLTSRRGAGTFVSPDLPDPPSARAGGADGRPAEARLSRRGRLVAETAAWSMTAFNRGPQLRVDFVYGLCEPDSRMVAHFRRSFAATLRRAPFRYPERQGDELLRRQLAARLRTGRGIARGPEHIVVTGGTQQALDICARLLVGEGDTVVLEDPTYHAAYSVFAAAGARIVNVPVDREGLVVSALPEHGPPVRLVYVTPSHQFPTGVVLPAARRFALLAWARRRGAYIFEDDYDSEFQYTGRPLEALAALDHAGPVIYCGTFAKSLFPSLRLGYLSLPAELVPATVGCRWLSDFGSPVILQQVVAELMAKGLYDRHIRRMLRRYRQRRETLVEALQKRLGDDVAIEGADTGLHLVARLPNLRAARLDALVAACGTRGVSIYSEQRGIAVYAAPHARGQARRPVRLLLGYGFLEVDQIEKGVRAIAAAYQEVTGSGR